MSKLFTRRAALIGLAAPAIIRPAHALMRGGFSTGGATTGFPGQAGNPVGFAASPGYPGSLNASPPAITSGTSGSPHVYSYYDFTSSFDVTNLSFVNFVGCRFQSNASSGVSMTITNSNNINFSYCSWTPLTSKATAPPNAAWPCAGAGLNLNYGSAGYTAYVIPQTSRYQNGVAFADTTSGPITWDHCDFWGFGNAAIQWNGTTAQQTVQDCWAHDCADPAGAIITPEHTDGIGYVLGGAAPQNIKIDHTVIAGMGPVNGIANQTFTTGHAYQNMLITNGYYSGFGSLIDFVHGAPSGKAGSTNNSFTGNTISSDIPWLTSPTQGDQSATVVTGNSNLWRTNKFLVIAGGVNWWTGQGISSGKFLWPDSSWNNTDYTG